ncbi:polysaccharide deacetylase family protein [Phenylobacterium sp.]|uniref:polysaccharide deacetylase family protein n=1 Tax=Phenylobacterium sp. TaxID=1871053 RepID=UPI002F42D0CB
MSLKSGVKSAIAVAWDAGSRLSRPAPKLTILYYHAVPAAQAAAFDTQMAYLKRTANIVAPDHTGPLAIDRPNVAVTFDDAFRSVRENALPALARHGVPATIYVPTGNLGRQPGWRMETSGDRDEVVMTAEEIAALPSDLIAIGSHTVSHPHLTKLSDEEVGEQFGASRAALEGLLGRTIDTLAFPYGDHDARVVELARQAGYRFVYTVAPQAIAAGDTATSRGRTGADPGDAPGLFALKTRGAFDWMPMASSLKRRLRPRS